MEGGKVHHRLRATGSRIGMPGARMFANQGCRLGLRRGQDCVPRVANSRVKLALVSTQCSSQVKLSQVNFSRLCQLKFLRFCATSRANPSSVRLCRRGCHPHKLLLILINLHRHKLPTQQKRKDWQEMLGGGRELFASPQKGTGVALTLREGLNAI